MRADVDKLIHHMLRFSKGMEELSKTVVDNMRVLHYLAAVTGVLIEKGIVTDEEVIAYKNKANSERSAIQPEGAGGMEGHNRDCKLQLLHREVDSNPEEHTGS